MIRKTAASATGAALILLATAVTPAFASARQHDPLAGKTASQIATKAVADVASASSVHFAGSATQQGMTISVSLSVSHKGCTGSFGLSSFGSFNIIQIGKSSWVQPNDQMWKLMGVSDADLPNYSGKWLLNPPGSSATHDLASTCSLSGFIGNPRSGWVKGKITSKHGVRELQLINKKQKMSIEVTDVAKPLILNVTQDGFTFKFSAYGAPLKLTPPPAADIVAPPPAPGN